MAYTGRPARSRNPNSSRRAGKPLTWQSGIGRQARGTQQRGQRNASVSCCELCCRRRNRKTTFDLKPTGEPDAVKVARPVRRGVVGKVPEGNSLATYPTEKAGRKLVAIPYSSCARLLAPVMRVVRQCISSNKKLMEVSYL